MDGLDLHRLDELVRRGLMSDRERHIALNRRLDTNKAPIRRR